MIDRQLKKDKINKYITDCKRSIGILEAVMPTLERYEGKMLNKRLATLVTKDTGYTCFFSTNYNLLNLEIWERSWNEKIQIFLGCKGQDTRFTMELFNKHNRALSLYHEQLRNYEVSLSFVDEWCTRLETIERLKEELEADSRVYGVNYIMIEER